MTFLRYIHAHTLTFENISLIINSVISIGKPYLAI
jgi:hypothetical protein